jgi:hypothetical protein
MHKYRRRSAGGIAVRATSADRSEDILVWTLGPKRIDRMRVRFSIKTRTAAQGSKHQSKGSLGVVSMPEEDVPQLSADAPFRSIRNVKADCQPVRRLSRVTVGPNSEWTPAHCSLKAVWVFGGGHFFVCDVSDARSNEFLSKLHWFTEQHRRFLLLGSQPAPEFRCR